MSSAGDKETNSDAQNPQDTVKEKDEEKNDNNEGIISRIADGVKEFAEALAAGERNVITDSLNHPASGQADLIATTLLEIDE
uniref:Uncharacterized protein n=1 Tax=Panagrolaimus sp. PS1159 TaxID=55785 RepID=A0AC35GID5_9BILA